MCRQWEAATDAATRKGVRVVHLRTGLVLSAKGGALGKMLLPFKLGVGGKIGSGRSVLELDFAGRRLRRDHSRHPADDDSRSSKHRFAFAGNQCGIHEIRRAGSSQADDFSDACVCRTACLGEMADALLLASARVEPAKLAASRFVFREQRTRTDAAPTVILPNVCWIAASSVAFSWKLTKCFTMVPVLSTKNIVGNTVTPP